MKKALKVVSFYCVVPLFMLFIMILVLPRLKMFYVESLLIFLMGNLSSLQAQVKTVMNLFEICITAFEVFPKEYGRGIRAIHARSSSPPCNPTPRYL
ncbi:hypothetical protein SUGI_1020930 [Cryptomeria japonica]|nr:hypothetical protein SUGI_1020930 [Cryptomeria japonica]